MASLALTGRLAEEAMAVVDGSEVCGKNEGHDGLQLHHDVQSRTRGVLHKGVHTSTSIYKAL